MANIQLIYFDMKGLAEPIRLLLKYGQIEFQDVRIAREDWPTLKPSTPFGQVPTYEENGKIIWQSLAICRYVAKKVNLTGSNDWDDLEIDAIVDTFKDLMQKLGEYGRTADPERKEQLRRPLFAETIPYYLGKLDNIAKENGGYLCLGKLTWADIYFFALSERLVQSYPGFTQYTNLEGVIKNVKSILQIKD